jgi:hypothetical protein
MVLSQEHLGGDWAMWYGYLADLVVAAHVLYVAYIVLGQAAILLGAALGWRWIRNPWFRWTHLLAIVLVALEAICGIDCPLTVWEGDLRRLAGQEASSSTFVGRILDEVIFYHAPAWVLNGIHIGFALLVLATLVLLPPRRRLTSR